MLTQVSFNLSTQVSATYPTIRNMMTIATPSTMSMPIFIWFACICAMKVIHANTFHTIITIASFSVINGNLCTWHYTGSTSDVFALGYSCSLKVKIHWHSWLAYDKVAITFIYCVPYLSNYPKSKPKLYKMCSYILLHWIVLYNYGMSLCANTFLDNSDMSNAPYMHE